MTLRVASLIPSATEIVAALGMADTLVGRSHCCDFPAEVEALPVLTRPKVDPNAPGEEIDETVRALMAAGESVYDILMEPLLAADPDVVITQDHCDACAVSLSEVQTAVACADLAGARVCALHPHDLDAITEDIRRVALALDVVERGERLAATFTTRLESLGRRTSGAVYRPRVALVEWLAPPMIAGGWIPELARIAGAEPLIVRDAVGFAEVSWADIDAQDADAVVLLPCGFSVERTLQEISTPAGEYVVPLTSELPGGLWVVDGDALFNRPGPRLADSAEVLAGLFQPEVSGIDMTNFEGLWKRLR